MKDFMALLARPARGRRDGAHAGRERRPPTPLFERWIDAAASIHRRLPGDHKGNPVVRFFWKGAGIVDDEVV